MFKSRVSFDHAMARCTTFRTGAEADAFMEVLEEEELCMLIPWVLKESLPYMVIGKGSNLLVKDGGFRGIVVRLGGKLSELGFDDSRKTRVLAGAGLSIKDFLLWCKVQGLAGMEFLAGIPGTLGGALFMNAGAFGEEICEHVGIIHMVTPTGLKKHLTKVELRFSYRKLEIETGDIITRICFQMEKGSKKEISQRMAGFLKQRRETQPLEFPSAGSVFKNPPGDFAGSLIEKAGLKGTRRGGAMISEKHANFIVNTGGANSKEILSLIDLAQRKVKEDFGVKLELEIQVVGE